MGNHVYVVRFPGNPQSHTRLDSKHTCLQHCPFLPDLMSLIATLSTNSLLSNSGIFLQRISRHVWVIDAFFNPEL
jgi:hypothetical protein